MTFFAVTDATDERYTPLHFYKPHVAASFTCCGSCIITNPDDPMERQIPSVCFVPNQVNQSHLKAILFF